jgi:hypothetical protein
MPLGFDYGYRRLCRRVVRDALPATGSAIAGGEEYLTLKGPKMDEQEMGASAAEVRVARLGEQLDAVLHLTAAAVVRKIVEALGAQLVAAIAGVGETRLVREWERGSGVAKHEPALAAALKATRAILATGSAATARSWWVGSSVNLEHLSPLEVIRENTPEALQRVLRAAVAFATQ